MSEFELGIGLDVGTAFLQVARQQTDGSVQFVSERDAFFAIQPETKQSAKMFENMLKKQGIFTLKSGDTFYVVGEEAIKMAIIRKGSTERPLKRGVLSAADLDSMGMLSVLLEALVGPAKVEGELCVYSYPADPADEAFDIVYHHNRIAEILTKLNYKPVPLLEAEALAYSELMEYDLTGISLSCGAGMHNLAVFHMGLNLCSFSVAQGGDYIDKKVARQLGKSETLVQQAKESGVNLLDPGNGDTMTKLIVDYYSDLINYVANVLEENFAIVENVPQFDTPVPVIVSGGTSLAEGYLQKMEEALKQRSFPFEIGEVKHAGDPLTAVANGCLVYAQSYEDE